MACGTDAGISRALAEGCALNTPSWARSLSIGTCAIPTALIGIQDTEQLLELAKWDDLYPEPAPASDDTEWDKNIELDVESDPVSDAELQCPPA